jgi:hypothetical protein
LLAKSRTLVEQYMRNSNSVEAALAGNALGISALDGNAALYDRYLEHMKTAKTPEEYYNYFGALTNFPNPELAKRTMEFVLGPDVKNQDLFFVGGLFGNPDTRRFTRLFCNAEPSGQRAPLAKRQGHCQRLYRTAFLAADELVRVLEEASCKRRAQREPLIEHRRWLPGALRRNRPDGVWPPGRIP